MKNTVGSNPEMNSIVKILPDIPEFVSQGLQYEVVTGSQAYGTANKDSDYDIYGFCIPDKDVIFPHLRGEIQGFGTPIKRFEQYQKQAIILKKKEYDITIYNIVKYFNLCMANNPNILDSLFVPKHCGLYIPEIGQHVINNRKIFLHKGSFWKFSGYAFSQRKKLLSKTAKPESKRSVIVNKYGYDTKYALHLVRLCLECKEILETGNLTLDKHADTLNRIKNGEWGMDDILGWFQIEEPKLKGYYEASKLPHRPDESRIKKLLIECLEMAYGSVPF